ASIPGNGGEGRSCFDLLRGFGEAAAGGLDAAKQFRTLVAAGAIDGGFALQEQIGELVVAARLAATDLNVPIAGFSPTGNAYQARCRLFVVGRAFNGVGDGSEEDVGTSLFYVIYGELDIGEILALIAPHQEHAGLD